MIIRMSKNQVVGGEGVVEDVAEAEAEDEDEAEVE